MRYVLGATRRSKWIFISPSENKKLLHNNNNNGNNSNRSNNQ